MKHLVTVLLLAACAWLGPSLSAAASLELVFTYGSEKQAWVDAVTRDFNQAGHRLSNGKRIRVDAIPMGSGAAVEELVNGTRQAHLTSPASGVFITLANHQWRERTGRDLIGQTRQLVLSPVVIAMWQPMAEALGWPERPIGWAQVFDMAGKAGGWSALGHPEWGRFKFGHTHPYHSNSGLISLLAEVYAATGKTRGLKLRDVRSPATKQFLQTIEASVVHYGKSTGFFGRKMLAHGPEYLSAAVLYENMVIESYAPGRQTEVPLVAIYPQEGTFWSDHPAGIVEREWVSDEHREAAGIYLDFLTAGPQQQRAMAFGFRPADVDIPLAAPFDRSHGVDSEQPQTTLKVPKAKVVRAVMELWKERKKHVDLVLVMDVSGSMKGERMANARLAAEELLRRLGDADRFSLLAFNQQTRWKVLDADLSKQRGLAAREIAKLKAGGGTALYDAVVVAHRRLAKQLDPQRIGAIVVLTDGADTRSRSKFQPMIRELQLSDQNPIRVFPIGYASDASARVLQTIADATRTKAYSGDPETIDEVFRDIATFF